MSRGKKCKRRHEIECSGYIQLSWLSGDLERKARGDGTKIQNPSVGILIAVVGALILAGEGEGGLVTWLGAIAVFASTTNLVSGYLITDRMLRMFKRREAPKS